MSHGTELTHVDLFSGIAGFSLASNWAGFRTVAFCERDNWCQQVIRRHWPTTPVHGDVRDFPGHLYRGATLLTGGFPCQPFSQCGKRRGKDDDRYLWPAMLDAIQSVRPSWIVAENVVGVVKMALPTVLADLEREGFRATVFLLPAHGVGAPHRRRRAWVVAESLNPDHDGLRPHREEVHEDGQGGKTEPRHEQVRLAGQMVPASLWESIDPGILGMADGISEVVDEDDRKHRIKGLGNAIVPQLAYEILKGIADIELGKVVDSNILVADSCGLR